MNIWIEWKVLAIQLCSYSLIKVILFQENALASNSIMGRTQDFTQLHHDIQRRINSVCTFIPITKVPNKFSQKLLSTDLPFDCIQIGREASTAMCKIIREERLLSSRDGYKLALSFHILVTMRFKIAVSRRLKALISYHSSQRILMETKLFECSLTGFSHPEMCLVSFFERS